MSQSTTLYVKFGDLELTYELGSRILGKSVGLSLSEDKHSDSNQWEGELAVSIVENEVFDYFRMIPMNNVLRAIIAESEHFMEMHRQSAAEHAERFPHLEPLPLHYTVRITLRD